MNTEITFINQSNDANNSQVVIFQKNSIESFDEIAVAWKVIENCAQGWSHVFIFPKDYQIAASDSYGNFSDLRPAITGQKWKVTKDQADENPSLELQSGGEKGIKIKNGFKIGSIDAHVYKDGKLLATKTGIIPMQSAVFEFEPCIWIGVVSQVKEGEILNSAILSDIETKISLQGIKKADLIMTGGGVGPLATPFQFELIPTL